jgi:hypothetical protein
MPRPTTEFLYARKSVRITVPIACDEHIATAATELEQLAQTLSAIHQQKAWRVSERVWDAQNEVQRTAMRLRKNVAKNEHLKNLR